MTVNIPNRIIDLNITVNSAVAGASFPLPPPPPSYTEQLFFASDIDGNFKIYRSNLDYSNKTLIIDNAATNRQPRLSPDGTKLIYNSDLVTAENPGGNNQLWIYDFATDTAEQITNVGSNVNGDWNHDGSKFVFESNRTNPIRLFFFNSDESELNGDTPTEFTAANGGGQAVDPQWSYDGTKILYAVFTTNPISLRTIDIDGNNDQAVANATPSYRGAWSKDSNTLLFLKEVGGIGPAASEIYKKSPVALGSTEIRLTNDAILDDNPAPSVNDQYIFWDQTISGYIKIYRMDFDGSNQIPISDNGNFNDHDPFCGLLNDLYL